MYFGEGYPTFNIIWEHKNDTLFFSSTQTTSTSVTPLFKMLMEYKLVSPTDGDTIIRVYQTNNINHYRIPTKKNITDIIVDPNNWVVNGNGSVILGLNEPQNPLCFTLFPNPCNNYVELNLFNAYTNKYKIEIYDLTGKLVLSEEYNSANIRINTNELPQGVYIMKGINDKSTYIKKFVKQ